MKTIPASIGKEKLCIGTYKLCIPRHFTYLGIILFLIYNVFSHGMEWIIGPRSRQNIITKITLQKNHISFKITSLFASTFFLISFENSDHTFWSIVDKLRSLKLFYLHILVFILINIHEFSYTAILLLGTTSRYTSIINSKISAVKIFFYGFCCNDEVHIFRGIEKSACQLSPW